MPGRTAVGTALRFLRRRAARPALQQAARRAVCAETLENRTLLSTTWYVSTGGSDSNAGTLNAPFRTIQAAATRANSGDTVDIMGGVYHETVTPAHSDVTFQAYDGQNVTVSGADPVTGWTKSSGNIYEAPVSWNLGEGSNQVFVNGQMVNEARWPNTSENLSDPTVEYAQSTSDHGNSITIYDSHLSGNWAGADIHILPGAGWYAQTGVVTASGSGWLTFNYTTDPAGSGYTAPRAGSGYYLYGKYQALDSAGEWYMDNSGHLYLWAPGNANPASLDVEVKHRDYAFNLDGDSNITLNNINIFAATIQTNSGSSGLVINHMNATYLSQFTTQPIGWEVPSNSGIELNGSGDLLENSTIAWSPGDGVYVGGSNVRVTEDVIHDVDYNAGDSAGVRIYGSNASVDHNLIYNTGRDGIADHGWAAQITYNTIHDAMLQTSDGGAIYTVNQSGSGSQIADNTIYDIHESVPGSAASEFSANGVFLDNSASDWSIHNNTITDTDVAVKMNYNSQNNHVQNNTLEGSVGSIGGSNGGSWSGTVISGNILYGSVVNANKGADITGNTTGQGKPSTGVSSAPPPPDPVPPASNSSEPSTGSSSNSGSSSTSSSGSSTTSNSGSSKSSSSSSKTDSDSSSTGSKTKTTTSTSSNEAVTPASEIVAPDVKVMPFVGPIVPQAISASGQIAASTFSSSLTAPTESNGTVQLSAGNWLAYGSVDFSSGVKTVTFDLSADTAGVRVQLRLDSPTGAVIGTLKPTVGKRGQAEHTQTVSIRKTTGVHTLYLVAVGKTGATDLSWFSLTPLAQKQTSR